MSGHDPVCSIIMTTSRSSNLLRILRPHHPYTHPRRSHRAFHLSTRHNVVKPFLLADIGEGITECQLIQWFVQPGARVEQFDRLCEVQSDKASVEITSPFDGVIKHLHYEPDDMAITGKPLVDIDIQSEITAEDESKLARGEGAADGEEGRGASNEVKEEEDGVAEDLNEPRSTSRSTEEQAPQHRPRRNRDMGTLATPAIRHLMKEMKVDIADVEGTGRDGRVLKEDVHRHMNQGKQQQQQRQQHQERSSAMAPAPSVMREDRELTLTPVQMQMFKTMTRSLSIPHFLYTSTADMTALTVLRKVLNASAASPEQRLTHLAFIVKAVSLAFLHHPLLNSSVDAKDPKKPELTYRGAHNFGVAIDAPVGLVVPVVRNVQDLSITDIASQLRQLSQKAKDNKLAPGDFSGATFTISNIGSIGGGVVSPVISDPQVAILGIGRSRIVPAFDENGGLVRKEEVVLSWSADHRVVDGAECARCAERVRRLLENPGAMLVEMR